LGDQRVDGGVFVIGAEAAIDGPRDAPFDMVDARSVGVSFFPPPAVVFFPRATLLDLNHRDLMKRSVESSVATLMGP